MRKNVLFITSDQQHWQTLGCVDHKIQTPNLDRLAARGCRFDRTYTVNPTCTPTRASWITGKFPSQHGAWTLGTKLSENEHTIGEDYLAAGFHTALVGKAHFQPLKSTEKYPSLEAYPILQDLNFWRNFEQPFYGFETVKLARNHTNEAHVGQHYALWLEEKGCSNWRDYFAAPTGRMTKEQTNALVWEIPEKYHYNTWIAEEANRLLEQYKNNNDSFFLWTSFFDPHPDYLVPEPWASMYNPDEIEIDRLPPGEHDHNSPFHQLSQQEHPDTSGYRKSGYALHGVHSHLHNRQQLKREIAVYYGMVSMMDKYIGQILDKLDVLGLTDDTLIVFTTDHGHLYGQHGLTAKGPFMYEDMIKVPMIASCKGCIPEGVADTSIQSLIDIAPTLLDYSGIALPDGMAGLSQRAVWNGESRPLRNYAICEHNHERDSICLRTYVEEHYKLTVYLGMDCGEIFDLKNDPGEKYNLWGNPDSADLKCRLMHSFLQAEMDREPHFMPRIAGA